MISNQLRAGQRKNDRTSSAGSFVKSPAHGGHVHKYISRLLQTFSLRGLWRGRAFARRSEIDNARFVGAGRGTLVGRFKRSRTDQMMTVITHTRYKGEYGKSAN